MFTSVINNQILVNDKFASAIICTIDNCSSSIDVMMFDWKWYKQDFSCDVSLINQALIRANKRGVKIRVLSNSVEIKQYFFPVGVQVRGFKVHGVFHPKLFIFDNTAFCIGSHNMTLGAMCRNYEVSFLCNDEKSAKSFGELFNSLWQ